MLHKMEMGPNCVGYALHRLNPEENKKETYVNPDDIVWTDLFTEVRSPRDADAVLVIASVDCDMAELVHIAVLDPQDKGLIHHRRKYGAKETTENLNVFLADFWNPIFDIVYVKRRT